jgi:hypothetical protein
MMILKVKSEFRLLWEKKNDQNNDDQLGSEIGNDIMKEEEEWSKEWWSIEKWNRKCDYYERRRRRIKKRWEIEKKNMKWNCYKKRRKIKRTMLNWKVKWKNKIIMREEEGSTEE